MNDIPIIYLHWGFCNYISKSIAKTHLFNSDIIYLDDTAINLYYSNMCEKFISSYKHLSRGGLDFESKCILRWLVILNYIKNNGIDKFFYCDSDVSLFTNISSEWFIDEDLCVMEPKREPKQGCASGHSSLWSLDALSQFGEFIIKCYNTDLFETLRSAQNGGLINVCDMFLIHLFGREYPHVSLAQVHDNSVFDDNFAYPDNYHKDEYEMFNGTKKVDFVEGVPYGYNRILQQRVKFNSIHYWGPLKSKIT